MTIRKKTRPIPIETDESTEKTVIRVRRGALRRFDLLKQKSAGLPVDITWDRRTDERREATATSAGHGTDRRRKERRQPPPFTWDVADFVVVGDRTPRADVAETDAASTEGEISPRRSRRRREDSQ